MTEPLLHPSPSIAIRIHHRKTLFHKEAHRSRPKPDLQQGSLPSGSYSDTETCSDTEASYNTEARAHHRRRPPPSKFALRHASCIANLAPGNSLIHIDHRQRRRHKSPDLQPGIPNQTSLLIQHKCLLKSTDNRANSNREAYFRILFRPRSLPPSPTPIYMSTTVHLRSRLLQLRSKLPSPAPT